MQEFRFPVGRLVGGSVYRPQGVTTNTGAPKIDPTTGKQEQRYSFGVAFEKKGSTHWGQTEWGAKVWAEGHAGFPNGEAQRPDFAWKIVDGDSTIPNKRGNKPADNDGFPGHWVVWFSGTYAPKLCDAQGTAQSCVTYMDGVERILPGHYVQVYGSVKDNKPSQSPGVYMNYMLTAHSGYGPVIALGNSVDPAKAGFGSDALPVGASAVPLGQPAVGAPPTGAPPAPPAGAPPAPPAPAAAPAAYTGAPDPRFLAPPAGMPVPGASMPPALAARVMTAKAGGYTFEQLVAGGWTEEALRAQGYMV